METLYYDDWGYNSRVLLNTLEKIVIKKGGKICQEIDMGNFMVNRTILENKKLLEEKFEEFPHLKNIPKFQEEYKRLCSFDNTPIYTKFGGIWGCSISFIYDGYLYHYSIDDNPLFEFYYTKTPILPGNKINITIHQTDHTKEKWNFELWKSTEMVEEIASQLFDMLLDSQVSKIYNNETKTLKILEEEVNNNEHKLK